MGHAGWLRTWRGSLRRRCWCWSWDWGVEYRRCEGPKETPVPKCEASGPIYLDPVLVMVLLLNHHPGLVPFLGEVPRLVLNEDLISNS